jgi:hypothetical protein
MSNDYDADAAAFDAKTYRRRVLRRDFEERFRRRQATVRRWVNFKEIAEWYSELHGQGGLPNEAACNRAYKMLKDDLLTGDFEEHGRSMVRYLLPYSERRHMTREWLASAIKTYPPPDPANTDERRRLVDTVRSQFLDHCWIPRHMFTRWLANHELPLSPPRFTPSVRGLSPPTAVCEPIVIESPVAPLVDKPPPPATHPTNRRGRRPTALNPVLAAMRQHIAAGTYTFEQLEAMTYKEMGKIYGATHDICGKAFRKLLQERD